MVGPLALLAAGGVASSEAPPAYYAATSSTHYSTGWAPRRTYDSMPPNSTFYDFRPPYNRYRWDNTSGLNRVQQGFVEWNALRLGISAHEARRRYVGSAMSISGGFARHTFRQFIEQNYHALSALASDRREEVFDAYRMHAPLQTLRFLSYTVRGRYSPLVPLLLDLASSNWPRGEPLVLVEFGAGLAHTSMSLAEELRLPLCRAGGAGNKMLLLLEGAAACYLQDRGVSRWDTCAAEAVLAAHGGVLVKLSRFAAAQQLAPYTYRRTTTNLDVEPGLAALTKYNAAVAVEGADAPRAQTAEQLQPYANVCGLLALPAGGQAALARYHAAIVRVSETTPPEYD